MGAPADGSNCQGLGGARCHYADTQCACIGGGNPNWNCSTCPAAAPADGDNCGQAEAGLHCLYGTTACSCFGGNWNC